MVFEDLGLCLFDFNEDFSKATMELIKSLCEEVLQYRLRNEIVYLNYRSIIVKDCVVR